MIARLFSRRWLLASVVVLAAAAVMVRLGIWQLDRLEQRRTFNARVVEQQEAEPLSLNQAVLDSDLYSMEYRRVIVTGEYLPEDEIVLRNQVWEDQFGAQLGVQLFTPLRIEGTDVAILVERGWIPMDHAGVNARTVYQEPRLVTVSGQLRRAETDFNLSESLHPDPTLAPDEERLDAWNNLNLERVASQTQLTLLPVYLQRFPNDDESSPPFAVRTTLDLSEGPHLGYALQWFAFATVLIVGYPFYVQRQELARKQ